MDKCLDLTTPYRTIPGTNTIVPCIACMYLLDLEFAGEKCPECGHATSASIDPTRLAMIDGALGTFLIAVASWTTAQFFAVAVTVYSVIVSPMSQNAQFTNTISWSLLSALAIGFAAEAYRRTFRVKKHLWICLSLPLCAAIAGASNCIYVASIFYASPLPPSHYFVSIGCASALVAFVGFHLLCYLLFMHVRSRAASVAHMMCIVTFVCLMACGIIDWLSDSTWMASGFFVLLGLLTLFECSTGLVGFNAILHLRNAVGRAPRP